MLFFSSVRGSLIQAHADQGKARISISDPLYFLHPCFLFQEMIITMKCRNVYAVFPEVRGISEGNCCELTQYCFSVVILYFHASFKFWLFYFICTSHGTLYGYIVRLKILRALHWIRHWRRKLWDRWLVSYLQKEKATKRQPKQNDCSRFIYNLKTALIRLNAQARLHHSMIHSSLIAGHDGKKRIKASISLTMV